MISLYASLVLNLTGETNEGRLDYMQAGAARDLLIKLTGQDFGLDVRAWAIWLTEHGKLLAGEYKLESTPESAGVVIEMGPGFACRVQLENGSETVAKIPKQVARDLFQVVPGNRVRLRLLEPGSWQITGFVQAQSDH